MIHVTNLFFYSFIDTPIFFNLLSGKTVDGFWLVGVVAKNTESRKDFLFVDHKIQT